MGWRGRVYNERWPIHLLDKIEKQIPNLGSIFNFLKYYAYLVPKTLITIYPKEMLNLNS
jgi:hypothetical protein